MNGTAKSPFLRRPLYGSVVVRDLLLAVIVVLAGVVFALSAGDFENLEYTKLLIFGLLAISFAYIWGHGGIFSFGQAALFGIGGYTYGIASINLMPATGESLSALLIAVAVSVAFSGAIGYFMFYGKVSDSYVAIVTLAISLVLMTVLQGTSAPEYRVGAAPLGGDNGMLGIPPITLPWGPLSITATFIALIVVICAVVVVLRLLNRASFGRIMAAVRQNELRTELLGYDVPRQKLVTFMIGAAIAGLGGALYAAWGLFINPLVFGLAQASAVAVWVLVGGRSSLLGAVVGVVIIERLSGVLGQNGSSATPIIIGAVLIAFVLLLPAGILPTLIGLARRLKPFHPKVASGYRPVQNGEEILFGRPSESAEPVKLTAAGLAKRFGGVHALRGVDVELQGPGVYCLLGPNGAGKSTFFNLVTGRYKSSAGSVTYKGVDITRWSAYRRARYGMGIKLQVSSIFEEATIFENLWLAAYAKTRNSSLATDRASAALDWLGLADRAHIQASDLAHGEKQWLEILMVVASDPTVILLDEPTAGMTRAETTRTAQLIQELAKHKLVIVVEHDMEFIRQLDAPVTMFHQGAVLTSGTIAELRADERVLDAYLGRGTASHAQPK